MASFVAASLALVAASMAHAQEFGLADPIDADTVATGDGPLVNEARIFLVGEAPLVCGIQFASDRASVDLTASRSLAVGFGLECNAPFRLTGRAANGALQRINAGTEGSGRTRLGYRVTWPILTNWGGGAIGGRLSGTSTEWSAGRSDVSAAPISPVSGEFTITWDDPRNLLAGDYDETFTVEIQLIN